MRPHRRVRTVRVALVAAVLSAGLLIHCMPESTIPYPATIRPVAFLIERIAGSRMSQALVHPGRNPETYNPSVADLIQFRDCRVLFYVAPRLDGWAANFRECPSHALLPEAPAKNDGGHRTGPSGHSHSRLEVFGPGDLSTKGGSGDESDPHFWTDPHRIEAVLPVLQKHLVQAEPRSAERIEQEVRILAQQMQSLEREAADRLKHLQGKRAVLMHPTYASFLREHGIEVVAIVEPLPGRELSVKEWRQLLALKPVDLIVHERQLPFRQARILSRELNAKIVELDPMGSRARNLTELLRNQLDALADLDL